MLHTKNHKTVSAFVKSYAEKTVASFSGHGVLIQAVLTATLCFCEKGSISTLDKIKTTE